MEVTRIVVSVVAVAVLSLAHVSAQEGSIGLGGKCQYSSDCMTMEGIVCEHNSAARANVCTCDSYHVPSDDYRECLKDIGAPCTKHDECTVQFKYQDARTCGAKHVCVCTGNGECGGSHALSGDYWY